MKDESIFPIKELPDAVFGLVMERLVFTEPIHNALDYADLISSLERDYDESAEIDVVFTALSGIVEEIQGVALPQLTDSRIRRGLTHESETHRLIAVAKTSPSLFFKLIASAASNAPLRSLFSETRVMVMDLVSTQQPQAQAQADPAVPLAAKNELVCIDTDKVRGGLFASSPTEDLMDVFVFGSQILPASLRPRLEEIHVPVGSRVVYYTLEKDQDGEDQDLSHASFRQLRISAFGLLHFGVTNSAGMAVFREDDGQGPEPAFQADDPYYALMPLDMRTKPFHMLMHGRNEESEGGRNYGPLDLLEFRWYSSDLDAIDMQRGNDRTLHETHNLVETTGIWALRRRTVDALYNQMVDAGATALPVRALSIDRMFMASRLVQDFQGVEELRLFIDRDRTANIFVDGSLQPKPPSKDPHPSRSSYFDLDAVAALPFVRNLQVLHLDLTPLDTINGFQALCKGLTSLTSLDLRSLDHPTSDALFTVAAFKTIVKHCAASLRSLTLRLPCEHAPGEALQLLSGLSRLTRLEVLPANTPVFDHCFYDLEPQAMEGLAKALTSPGLASSLRSLTLMDAMHPSLFLSLPGRLTSLALGSHPYKASEYFNLWSWSAPCVSSLRELSLGVRMNGACAHATSDEHALCPVWESEYGVDLKQLRRLTKLRLEYIHHASSLEHKPIEEAPVLPIVHLPMGGRLRTLELVYTSDSDKLGVCLQHRDAALLSRFKNLGDVAGTLTSLRIEIHDSTSPGESRTETGTDRLEARENTETGEIMFSIKPRRRFLCTSSSGCSMCMTCMDWSSLTQLSQLTSLESLSYAGPIINLDPDLRMFFRRIKKHAPPSLKEIDLSGAYMHVARHSWTTRVPLGGGLQDLSGNNEPKPVELCDDPGPFRYQQSVVQDTWRVYRSVFPKPDVQTGGDDTAATAAMGTAAKQAPLLRLHNI